MSSLILRGYGKYDRIITRGYGDGWLGIFRAEIIRLVSRLARVVSLDTKLNRGC